MHDASKRDRKIISYLTKAGETKTLSCQKTRKKKKCKTKEEKGPVIMVQGKLVAENMEKIS